MKKKRLFSLLEVLIALFIISFSLPLLISPFFYSALDEIQALEKMQVYSASQQFLATFLQDLHLGKIVLNESYKAPIETDKVLGFYQLKRLKDKKNKSVTLWQVDFQIRAKNSKNLSSFKYNFIVESPSNSPESEE